MDSTVTINRLTTSFVLPAEKQAAAYAALLALAQRGGGLLPYRGALSLPDLLRECWHCTLTVDPRTGAGRAFACAEVQGAKGAWDLFFRTLAPSVNADGYVVFFTGAQPGRRVREYHFDGQTAFSLDYAWGPTLDEVGRARTEALGSQVKRKDQVKVRTHYSGDVKFLYEPHEARQWLTENPNPICFASNAFHHKEQALAYVERLYRLGAGRVCVTQVFGRLCDILVEGGPYADSLSVQLPVDQSQAQELRDFCLHHTPPDHGKTILAYVAGSWWEEAIPDEGWIGMIWD